MTHCKFDSEKWRSRPIVGSATLTIVRSTTVMKNETASTANARQRRIWGIDSVFITTFLASASRWLPASPVA